MRVIGVIFWGIAIVVTGIYVGVAVAFRPSEVTVWLALFGGLLTILTFLCSAYWTHFRGPSITAIEPPVVVLESDGTREGPLGCGKPLRLYVPLTFTNSGAAPGIVSDIGIGLVLESTAAGAWARWETDWPGPNDPVATDSRYWDANPIEVPAHGSVGRTVKLIVRDYLGEDPERPPLRTPHDGSARAFARGDRPHPESPATMLRAGEVWLQLRVRIDGALKDMGWQWQGNIGERDVDELAKGDPALKRRIGRHPGMWDTTPPA